MGNGTAKIGLCFDAATGDISLRRETATFVLEEGFGHSFCYIRPPEEDPVVQKNNDSKTTTFRAISGASVSANNSTPLSTDASFSVASPASATFESSTLFSSTPLQPVPRHSYAGSGPVERGFLSGPFERASAEISVSSTSSDCSEPKSNPKKKKKQKEKQKQKKRSSMIRLMKLLFRRDHSIKSDGKKSIVISPGMTKSPEKERSDTDKNSNNNYNNKSMGVISESSSSNTTDLSSNLSKDSTVREEEEEDEELSLQWAQGKAGEDRVHVVISEENGGWVFVGIYDGFNGPDAPEYLLLNLYEAVQSELRGSEVLPAMEAALRRTEEGFLEAADLRVGENPELALMGSCVLVMVMKGEDVYVMNVGDSRAVLARERESGDADEQAVNRSMSSNLSWVQLTTEHSTSSDEEVERIRREHEEDSGAVVNSRVKGYLKVTRAFGAGFLKHPKWNDGLLEMFRIQYVGRKPYLTCEPSLVHYRLGPADRFLILSSDGLYQYFTNQQAVSEVCLFMASFPEGDPAQHLAEELLFRAATKAGMDFHQLLDIPQGERRRYHDDISIIVISFQGRIWRSSL